FEDVRVPKENLVAKRGQGWEVGTNTLFHERNMLGRSNQSETMLRNCVDVMRENGTIDDPVFRQRLMEIEARVQAMKFHGLRLLTDRLKGRSSGVAALVTKLN